MTMGILRLIFAGVFVLFILTPFKIFIDDVIYRKRQQKKDEDAERKKRADMEKAAAKAQREWDNLSEVERCIRVQKQIELQQEHKKNNQKKEDQWWERVRVLLKEHPGEYFSEKRISSSLSATYEELSYLSHIHYILINFESPDFGHAEFGGVIYYYFGKR